MSELIAALHILAAILLIGPVAVATSAIAPAYKKARAGDAAAVGSLVTLARMSRTYGLASLAVPALGLVALFVVPGASKEVEFHIAALLAVVAWVVLFVSVLPTQRKALIAAGVTDPSEAPVSDKDRAAAEKDAIKLRGKLAMTAGIFNLLWLIVALLMFL